MDRLESTDCIASVSRQQSVGLPHAKGRPGSGAAFDWSSAGLFVAELRLAFLDEGGHAFFLVFSCEERMERAAFEQQAFG
ncbi:hypothetical protein BXY66_2808 [Shimia isoporae]|uniref:Uncharacterized protein n=1 Tax=Shimia isoporae TaxID=647720 RepID=A0A4R1NCV2_9RHOB|nr:hypothetical protein BXY66_2808 [Shimia isoporae]